MREGGRAVGVLGVRVGELLRRGVPGEGVEGAQEGVPCVVIVVFISVVIRNARCVIVIVVRSGSCSRRPIKCGEVCMILLGVDRVHFVHQLFFVHQHP